MKNLFIVLLFLMGLLGCNSNNVQKKDILAKVGDNVLTKRELKEILLENGINGKDSIYFIKSYIKNWVINQKLRQEAEKYLNDLDKAAIEKLVEDYKTDLYVNKYKQLYIKQKLDTVVSDTELASFYNTCDFDYLLKTPIVKGIEIKVPKRAYTYYKLRDLMRNAEKNYDEITKLCKENKFYFTDFGDNWIDFEKVSNIYNIGTKDLKKRHLYIHTLPYDSLKDGILYISDCLLPGDTIPFSVIKKDLKKIIIHKRKEKLFYQLSNNAFEDVINDKNNYINRMYVEDNK